MNSRTETKGSGLNQGRPDPSNVLPLSVHLIRICINTIVNRVVRVKKLDIREQNAVFEKRQWSA